LFDGPYGLYVKQGKVNASLPEGTTADTLTLEQAIELLAAKAASSPSRSRSGAKTAAAAGGSAAKTRAAATKGATKGRTTAKDPGAATARKTPATTKTGRLRASAVRVIKPAGS
jgi:DNA topoisomerase-1